MFGALHKLGVGSLLRKYLEKHFTTQGQFKGKRVDHLKLLLHAARLLSPGWLASDD